MKHKSFSFSTVLHLCDSSSLPRAALHKKSSAVCVLFIIINYYTVNPSSGLSWPPISDLDVESNLRT